MHYKEKYKLGLSRELGPGVDYGGAWVLPPPQTPGGLHTGAAEPDFGTQCRQKQVFMVLKALESWVQF